MRRCLAALAASSLLACSVEETLTRPASVASLAAGEARDGTLHVEDDTCTTVQLRPDDTLTLHLTNGRSLKGLASAFCTDRTGLALSKGADRFCFEGDIVPWRNIESATIEQPDTGRSVAGLLLFPPLLLISVLSLRFDALSALGTTPPDAPRNCMKGPAVDRTTIDAADAAPIFSGTAIRRADVRPSVRIDAAPCFTQGGCMLGSARGGATILDVFDLSAGVRWERGRSDRVMATLGGGLQGWFAKAQWISTVAGIQFGAGSGLRVVPSVGVRLRPIAGLAIGVMPLAFTYFAANDPRGKKGTLYTPSLDVGYEF